MFDLILAGGTVVDGTRAKPYEANLCIKDGKIERITDEPVTDAKEVVDITGLTVAPGFIDIHTHSDAAPLVNYLADSKLAQGVTTEVCGNCGISNLPATPEHIDEINDYFTSQLEMPLDGVMPARMSISEYAADVDKKGTIINVCSLVGHGTLRLAAMGFVNRAPSHEEMNRLKALLEQELECGAVGMSLGLIYPPSAFSAKEELIELAKVLRNHDAILTVHMRNEGPKVFEAVEEMLEIAEQSGVHLHISHLKLMGKPQWGQSAKLLRKIEYAKANGVNVTCDQYPFTASSTSLTAVLPNWAHEGGIPEMMRRMETKEGSLCEQVRQNVEDRGGANTILITSTHGYHPEWEGKYISDLAQEFELSAEDTVLKVLIDCNTSVACVYFCMDEGDMLNIMKQMYICIGSDGYSMSYDPKFTKTNPHPRSFATFPQFFQIVREHNLMPVEDAVYKVTGLPAQILGLNDRGALREGNVADITVFDWNRFASRSTFLDSKVRPSGMHHVLVKGNFALRDGVVTDVRAGSVLLKK